MQGNILYKKKGIDLYFILIFFVAFSIRLNFAFTHASPLSGDEPTYESIGNSLSLGQGYTLNGQLTAGKSPGYPLFIAGVYALFGHDFVAIRIAQAVVDAMMCAVIYLIASKLFNRKIGCLAGILSAVHYFFLSSIQLLRPDTIQMFFIVLSVLYWIKWRESFLKRDIALMGLFSSASIMLKANAIFLPLSFISIELFNFLKTKRHQTNIFMIHLLVFILAVSLLIAPWIVRNYKVFHSLIFFSTEVGSALYASYNPPEGKKFGLAPKDSVIAEAFKMQSEVDQNKFLILKSKEYISTHKKQVIQLLPLKVLFFWSLFDWETLSDDGEGVYNFATAFILPFTILGLVILRRDLWRLTPIILPIIYFFLFIGLVFQGLPRYRLPIEPFLIIFAAFCIVYLYERFSKAKTILCISAWFLLNFTMFIYSTEVKIFARSIFEKVGLW